MENEDFSKQNVRTILRTPEFIAFYESLSSKVQTKFQYVMAVIASVYNVSTKFIKHLENTDLYDLRVSVGTNEYRTVLFAIDHDNFIEAKKIILLNGFLKKDNKDYRKQIEKALTIINNMEL
ncbi:MAG: type II toxin-antitoxin system RelE/ParE family toxin [Bacteroides sp.]|nr:type II toxin-antitoxin system RelE/ParE family toxin [Bacteroides sp.]MCM1379613.1 type II toxin-antitoxin system RelE/ParE family toxin [Bacteroides sp.]MCM1446005.1 type II toxin-antitoxin system RelE/ParE family toxin [Prevotella sp.]